MIGGTCNKAGKVGKSIKVLNWNLPMDKTFGKIILNLTLKMRCIGLIWLGMRSSGELT